MIKCKFDQIWDIIWDAKSQCKFDKIIRNEIGRIMNLRGPLFQKIKIFSCTRHFAIIVLRFINAYDGSKFTSGIALCVLIISYQSANFSGL